MRFRHVPARLAGPLLCIALVALGNGCANKEPASPGGTTGGGGQAAGPKGTPIIVGAYGSLTGPTSTFGTSSDSGIRLALDAANKAGGVNGHPLQLAEGHTLNDEGKPDTTLTVIQKMTTQDNPVAVLGEVASTLSLTAAPVCNKSGVPMISPSSTNPRVTQVGPYIFRVCFIDEFQGRAAAQFAFQNLKARKIAIFTDLKSDYSTGLRDYFTTNFQKMGGKIVSSQTYSAGALDFHAQLQQIKTTAPDVVYVPGYYTDIGPIARQAKEVGLSVPLLGGDGWDSPKLVKGAGGPGGALEGSYFTNHYSINSPEPTVRQFVADFKAANGDATPDALAGLAYDATGVLIAALKSLPAPADGNYSSPAFRTKVRDAIAATKGFQGVTGSITLGPDRNAVKPLVVLQIKGGDFQPAATIQP